MTELLRSGVGQETDQAQLRGLLIRLGAQRLLQEPTGQGCAAPAGQTKGDGDGSMTRDAHPLTGNPGLDRAPAPGAQEELLDIIEAKGREESEALAVRCATKSGALRRKAGD